VRAAVLHASGDLRIEERDIPVPGESDVLIEVSYNGLCGTDATEFSKGPFMVPLTERHPGSGHLGPTTLGHEFIGTIVDAGAAARDRIGERVACGAGISCGDCSWCRAGRTNLCARYFTLGLSTHGGLADFVAAPASICATIPDAIPDLNAALAQPLAVGIHAVRRATLAPGRPVAILGVGAIGSFVCAALAAHDGPVIAFDIEPSRLDAARELGAHETHLVSPDASPADLRDLLPDGAPTVFETSGAKGSAERAIGLAERGGNVVLVGLNTAPQPMALSAVVLKEINLSTTVAHVCSTDLPASLDLLARMPLADILKVGVVPLEDVVNAGIRPLVDGSARSKILVEVSPR